MASDEMAAVASSSDGGSDSNKINKPYFRFIPFWNIPPIHSVNGSDNGGDEGSDNDGGGGNGDRRNGSCGR
jgi:hypothetical protein